MEKLITDKNEDLKVRKARKEYVSITEYEIRNDFEKQANLLRTEKELLDLDIAINQKQKEIEENIGVD